MIFLFQQTGNKCEQCWESECKQVLVVLTVWLSQLHPSKLDQRLMMNNHHQKWYLQLFLIPLGFDCASILTVKVAPVKPHC